jgi:hypothetical protein
MPVFLNPIQFDVAAREAGIDKAASRRLYGEAAQALAMLTPRDVKERGVPQPLTPRVVPPAARSPLREALERQNADRAAAVEVALLPTVSVVVCAGFVADVRIAGG